MAIQAINIENTKSNKPVIKGQAKQPYLQAQGLITTTNNVKPLPAQGHLIHDSFGNKIKYFFKDIAYDFKSVKNGFNGTANDHQLGRLNDVGLKMGGIGIAAYLASKTKDPKVRLMEYFGLGAFLTAMAIYPKIAINAPAKLVHGFDIDKQYIDDQGRKKSVFQDSNYIPFDMYRSEINAEDLDKIGDRLGIPRDVINRHDVIKEQMRKIATQNNTLWMLTAGLMTPAISALACYGFENIIGPTIENVRNKNINKLISQVLNTTENMTLNLEKIGKNELSENVAKILKSFEGQELPESELKRLLQNLTENFDAAAAQAIRQDIRGVLEASSGNNFVINETILENTIKNIGNRKSRIQDFVPSKNEIENIIQSVKNVDFTKDGVLSNEQINTIREKLEELFAKKRDKLTQKVPEKFFISEKRAYIDIIMDSLTAQKSTMLTQDATDKIVSFAKIIGEFKSNKLSLDKCKHFKFEYDTETVLANYYSKFEQILIKELGFSQKELKKMKLSESYTQNILSEKLAEVAKSSSKYENLIKKLAKVMSEMEVSLHGAFGEKSNILDLINAIENNYNNTARRLAQLDKNSFAETIGRLVEQDVLTLENPLKSRQNVFDYLDGILGNKVAELETRGLSPEEIRSYVKANSDRLGSSKHMEISRLLERYQGVKSTFNRFIHTLEVFKRTTSPEEFRALLKNSNNEYVEAIINKAREVLLGATTGQHTTRLNTTNNSNFYKDLFKAVWLIEGEKAGVKYTTKTKGYVTEALKQVFADFNSMKKGNILDRFQYYINRFKLLIANNPNDFTKEDTHSINKALRSLFGLTERNNTSIFNLVGKNPIDLIKEGAEHRYGTQQWFKIIGGFTAGVFGLTLLAQFAFGKLSNPQNLKRQVNNDANT